MAWYWIVMIVLGALWALTMLMYWFNLDNRFIYAVVKPMLDKHYGKQHRDTKL